MQEAAEVVIIGGTSTRPRFGLPSQRKWTGSADTPTLAESDVEMNHMLVKPNASYSPNPPSPSKKKSRASKRTAGVPVPVPPSTTPPGVIVPRKGAFLHRIEEYTAHHAISNIARWSDDGSKLYLFDRDAFRKALNELGWVSQMDWHSMLSQFRNYKFALVDPPAYTPFEKVQHAQNPAFVVLTRPDYRFDFSKEYNYSALPHSAYHPSSFKTLVDRSRNSSIDSLRAATPASLDAAHHSRAASAALDGEAAASPQDDEDSEADQIKAEEEDDVPSPVLGKGRQSKKMAQSAIDLQLAADSAYSDDDNDSTNVSFHIPQRNAESLQEPCTPASLPPPESEFPAKTDEEQYMPNDIGKRDEEEEHVHVVKSWLTRRDNELVSADVEDRAVEDEAVANAAALPGPSSVVSRTTRSSSLKAAAQAKARARNPSKSKKASSSRKRKTALQSRGPHTLRARPTKLELPDSLPLRATNGAGTYRRTSQNSQSAMYIPTPPPSARHEKAPNVKPDLLATPCAPPFSAGTPEEQDYSEPTTDAPPTKQETPEIPAVEPFCSEKRKQENLHSDIDSPLTDVGELVGDEEERGTESTEIKLTIMADEDFGREESVDCLGLTKLRLTACDKSAASAEEDGASEGVPIGSNRLDLHFPRLVGYSPGPSVEEDEQETQDMRISEASGRTRDSKASVITRHGFIVAEEEGEDVVQPEASEAQKLECPTEKEGCTSTRFTTPYECPAALTHGELLTSVPNARPALPKDTESGVDDSTATIAASSSVVKEAEPLFQIGLDDLDALELYALCVPPNAHIGFCDPYAAALEEKARKMVDKTGGGIAMSPIHDTNAQPFAPSESFLTARALTEPATSLLPAKTLCASVPMTANEMLLMSYDDIAAVLAAHADSGPGPVDSISIDSGPSLWEDGLWVPSKSHVPNCKCGKCVPPSAAVEGAQKPEEVEEVDEDAEGEPDLTPEEWLAEQETSRPRAPVPDSSNGPESCRYSSEETVDDPDLYINIKPRTQDELPSCFAPPPQPTSEVCLPLSALEVIPNAVDAAPRQPKLVSYPHEHAVAEGRPSSSWSAGETVRTKSLEDLHACTASLLPVPPDSRSPGKRDKKRDAEGFRAPHTPSRFKGRKNIEKGKMKMPSSQASAEIREIKASIQSTYGMPLELASAMRAPPLQGNATPARTSVQRLEVLIEGPLSCRSPDKTGLSKTGSSDSLFTTRQSSLSLSPQKINEQRLKRQAKPDGGERSPAAQAGVGSTIYDRPAPAGLLDRGELQLNSSGNNTATNGATRAPKRRYEDISTSDFEADSAAGPSSEAGGRPSESRKPATPRSRAGYQKQTLNKIKKPV